MAPFREPDRLAEVLSLLGVVVVAVDFLVPIHRDAEYFSTQATNRSIISSRFEQGVGLAPSASAGCRPRTRRCLPGRERSLCGKESTTARREHLRDVDVMLGERCRHPESECRNNQIRPVSSRDLDEVDFRGDHVG